MTDRTNNHQKSEPEPNPRTDDAPIVIENIGQMRREAGIEDRELHDAVLRLQIGDMVWLTLLTTDRTAEMVLVQISDLRNHRFRGKFAKLPAHARLRALPNETMLSFTSEHIHSVHHVDQDLKPRRRLPRNEICTPRGVHDLSNEE